MLYVHEHEKNLHFSKNLIFTYKKFLARHAAKLHLEPSQFSKVGVGELNLNEYHPR